MLAFVSKLNKKITVKENKNKVKVFIILMKQKYRDIKIFCLAFFAFLLANFIYENATTVANANKVMFKEVTVNVEGDLELELNCSGTEKPNSPKENRGLGNSSTNKCKGTGKIKASFPQQRFIRP